MLKMYYRMRIYIIRIKIGPKKDRPILVLFQGARAILKLKKLKKFFFIFSIKKLIFIEGLKKH
mgnify:CR=1 FL=1